MPIADILLTLATLAVAITGILWKDPKPPRIKGLLIALAIVASILAISKALDDYSDKKFLETALEATITPPNSVFPRLINDIRPVASKEDFDVTDWHHSSDGMICFLKSTKPDPAGDGLLVFNKFDVASMYAAQIQKKSTTNLVKEEFKKRYVPTEFTEEFADKVGVLGTGVFFDMFGRWPKDYDYDDSFGVKVIYENDGRTAEVILSKDELAQFHQRDATALFYAIAQLFREKFKQQVQQQPKP